MESLRNRPLSPYLSDSLVDREDEVLTLMRQRYQDCMTTESDLRERQRDDQAFRAGQQWDARDEATRLAAKRPCLTINTTQQYEGQIVNEVRRNVPAMRALPVGNGADVQTAKVLQGILRHIEQRSHATDAYITAVEQAARIGRGFFRLRLAYEDPMSFEQEILIERIRNPFQVVIDHHAQDFCGRDARYGFIATLVDKQQHQLEYGVDSATMGHWSQEDDTWMVADQVRMTEYFFRDPVPMTLALLDDGSTHLLEPLLLGVGEDIDKLPQLEAGVKRLVTPERGMRLLPWIRQQTAEAARWLEPFGQDFATWYLSQLGAVVGRMVQVRKTYTERIWHIKSNGHVVLEESLWPGRYIPLIPVIGIELDQNGRVDYSGFIRNGKDPMRMKNFWSTMQAEHIALAPPSPWLVAEGQVEGYEDEWGTANRVPYAYLTWKPISVQGTLLPPPQRNLYEPPIQAITMAMQGSEADTQAAIGIYRASLGAPSAERSGKAIVARDQQADTGIFHYSDNLRRAIQYCGEQLIDLLQNERLMPPEKVQRILGDDNSVSMVYLKRGMQPGEQLPQGVQGIDGIYDISTGRYDVLVTTGPGYETKRQEAVEAMVDIGKMNPKVAELGADILVRHIDLEGTDELARRLKKSLPPELHEDTPEGEAPDPETQVLQLQAQAQEMTQQLEAVNAYAQECEQKLEAATAVAESHEAEVALKARELAIKEREVVLKEQVAAWQHEEAMLNLRLERERQHDSREESDDARVDVTV